MTTASTIVTPPKQSAPQVFLAGWREIGGTRKYYRSLWEANYARYLEWLRTRGEILAWAHEPETFWFAGIRRGTVSYKPDFRVTERSGKIVWHEVKGYMSAQNKVALRRMTKYHPRETVIVIDKKQYAVIAATMHRMVPGWEYSSVTRAARALPVQAPGAPHRRP